MNRSNLYVIIAALVGVYVITLVAAYFLPQGIGALKELATMVMGGLLAIMRPPSQQVG